MNGITIGNVGPFTPQQAAKLLDMPYTSLDTWNRRGFIHPSVQESQGRGKQRYYSFSDLVALRVARELRDAGISLQALRKVIKHLTEIGIPEPLKNAYLVTDGKDVFVKDEAGVMSALKQPGQRLLVYTVDLAAAVEELQEKVKELAA